jgi:hypothetical protein
LETLADLVGKNPMDTVAILVCAWRWKGFRCPFSLPVLLEEDEMVSAAGYAFCRKLTCFVARQAFAHVLATSEARAVREGPHNEGGLRWRDDRIEFLNQGFASPPQLFEIGAALFI